MQRNMRDREYLMARSEQVDMSSCRRLDEFSRIIDLDSHYY